jgi:hypothetical protein
MLVWVPAGQRHAAVDVLLEDLRARPRMTPQRLLCVVRAAEDAFLENHSTLSNAGLTPGPPPSAW